MNADSFRGSGVVQIAGECIADEIRCVHGNKLSLGRSFTTPTPRVHQTPVTSQNVCQSVIRSPTVRPNVCPFLLSMMLPDQGHRRVTNTCEPDPLEAVEDSPSVDDGSMARPSRGILVVDDEVD